MPTSCGGILRSEVEEFGRQLEQILQGKDRGRVMRDFGDIYWEEEEASFLRLTRDFETFYRELHEVVRVFLRERGVVFSEAELAEALAYQRLRMPLADGAVLRGEKVFAYNFPEYFEYYYTPQQVPLRQTAQALALVDVKDYHGDKKQYARETILWGRKSGTMLTKVTWRSLDEGAALSMPTAQPARVSV